MASSFVRAAFAARLRTYWSSTPIYVAGRKAIKSDGTIVDPETISLPLNPAELVADYLFLEFPVAGEEMREWGDPGNNLFVEEGVARFVYLALEGSDLEAAHTALDSLRAHFRSVRFGTDSAIIAWPPDPPTEPYLTGTYYELAVAVPYWRHLNG